MRKTQGFPSIGGAWREVLVRKVLGAEAAESIDRALAAQGRRVHVRRGDSPTVLRAASRDECDTRNMTGTGQQTDQQLERAILELLDARAPAATICPSDAARAVHAGDDDGWRALMEPARRAARRLVAAGEVEITQGGRPVAPAEARGPIRIRRVR